MRQTVKCKGINRIEKRAIEALAILPIIELISKKIGRDEAKAMLKEANQTEAFQRGQSMAKKQNVIDELAKDVDTWGEGGNYIEGRLMQVGSWDTQSWWR